MTDKDTLNLEERQAAFIRRIQEERREKNLLAKTFIGILIVIFGILASVLILTGDKFAAKNFGENSFITKFLKSIDAKNKEHADFGLPFGLKRQNILFLGVDASENPDDPWTGTRTDTIILVNIDPKTKSANAISVPRDSKVYLPKDYGVNKINSAHAIGGVEMTKRTIEDTLGVKIDKYILLHDNAVKEIVDAMDGLDVYIEKPMRYNDYSGKLHINFDKGEHHLSGQEAVEYLRFRHDALGDIGRTQRQQWLMRSLLEKLKNPSTVTKIPDIISVARKYIKTDMSFYEMTQYAALVKNIDIEKTEIATLPGAPNQRGYISYWILDPAKTQEVINRLIYRDIEPLGDYTKFSAGVMASDSKKGEEVSEALKNAGIEVKCTGTLTRTHSQFIAHSKEVTNNYYSMLTKNETAPKGLQFVYDPINYYCGETDFTIIIADN